MSTKIIQNVLKMENNKIEINEKCIYEEGIASAHITNAFIYADVKKCSGQSIRVDVQYSGNKPQVIDRIEPKVGNKISVNITEELNCLVKFAFQYSGNPEHDEKICIVFNSDISLDNINLYVEYIPNQIMHENSAYVDFDVRNAGNGQINLATGLLRFKHACGDVGLVYNNWQAKRRSSCIYDLEANEKVKKYKHGVGKGFKLNVEQFLVKRKGMDEQSVYTYIDGDGNYHEFSEKYYYLNEKNKKIFVPKSAVQVDMDGKLKYAIDKYHYKKINVERKTTNGLFLEQDFSVFKGGKYIEQRQNEQIELEENVAALARQLKQYVIVDKTTGGITKINNELKKLFSSKKDELSISNFEQFQKNLDCNLLLTESEAIQYRSLLLQQTNVGNVETALLMTNSSYKKGSNYSDDKISEKKFSTVYNNTLISMRKLVRDLRKDYAKLTEKVECKHSNATNRTKHPYQYQYQYVEYLKYLKEHGYATDNCCIDIKSQSRDGKLTSNEDNAEGTNNLTIKIGHYNVGNIEGFKNITKEYCDLQAELERINDDLDAFYRGKDSETANMKVRQKVVEQRLRIFNKEFAYRTDKLQANINKFEAELNEFVEQEQGKIINRQIELMVANSECNKADLEKYFKQYYNQKRELTQLLWQMPKYFIKDNDGVIMGFNKDGYLVALFDNYENQTAIVYEKGQISSIQDTDGNVTTFKYGKNHHIDKIVTADSKTYCLEYERNKGMLMQITDGNGEQTHLHYDRYGFLNAVEDHFGFGVKFTYDKYGRITQVYGTTKIESVADEVVSATSDEQKSLAAIDYHDTHLTTSVTDDKGVVTTYNFDILGKVVTAYEGKYTDLNETTQARSFEYTDNHKSFAISDNLFGANLITNPSMIVLEGTKDDSVQKATQSVDVPLPQDGTTDYVFSVWAKADSAYVESPRSMQYSSTKSNEKYNITNDEKKRNRKFEVRAEVYYADGSKSEQPFVAYFDWLNTQWQYVALPIEINADKQPKKCTIILDYSYNTGAAQFDCLSLRQGNWTYNEFDEEGKKTYGEDSTSKTHTQYFYDDGDKLVKEVLTDRKGRTFESKYEYNAQGVLVRSISYNGTVTEHVFDDKGRETKQIVYNLEDPSSKMYTESKRDDKGVVTADVDESGEYDAVTYTYDQNGEIAVQTDGKGNKTAYGYKDGKQISVSSSTEGEESVNKQSLIANLLTKVTNGETEFNYIYDGWGRTTKIRLANNPYAETTYVDNFTTKTTLANKDVVVNKRDKYGNVTEQSVQHSDKTTQKVTNTYDDETRRLLQSTVDTDGKTEYNIHYTYDAKGNVVKEVKDGNFALTKSNAYTKDNDLEATEYTVGTQKLKYEFETDHTPDKRSAKVVLPFGTQQNLTYDGLGRTKEVSLGNNLVKDIFYAKYGDHATSRVSSVWYGVNGIRKENTRYTYDKAGNIETVTDNGKLVARYSYDGLNRLVREDNIHFGTFTYCYDHAGNILRKTAYPFTLAKTISAKGTEVEYEYAQHGWRDQLLSFKGTKRVYDALGNPTAYRGYNLSWQGRRLTKYDEVEYTYDANGIRTSKRDENKEIKFFVDNNQIVAEQTIVGKSTSVRYYFYGADGIAGFSQNDVTYLFRKNVQGDITHIYTTDGTLVGQYAYDAWGKCNILLDKDSIATANPFRYRGYYFDYETGFYYLQTRYYDPETGRFISADSIEYLDPETLGGLNLYAYCGNNPVMDVDPEGTNWKDTWWGKALGWVITATEVVAAVVMIGAVAIGSVASGGLLAAVLVGAGVGILAGVGGSIVAQSENYREVNPWQVVTSGFIGGVIGAVSGVASFGLAQAGQVIGQSVGFTLSNATHIGTGVKIAKIFGLTTSMLMKAGSAVGGMVGGFIAGTITNKLMNEIVTAIWGQDYNVENPNYIRSLLLKFFQWIWG